MIATLLLALVCLAPENQLAPFTIQTYSVRSDGAGDACDCSLAPCGDRGGCQECDEVGCRPCPPLLESGCFLGTPDECGNLGACAYLDVHAYPGAIPWRQFEVSMDGCFETEFQEVAVGWMAWWRVE